MAKRRRKKGGGWGAILILIIVIGILRSFKSDNENQPRNNIYVPSSPRSFTSSTPRNVSTATPRRTATTRPSPTAEPEIFYFVASANIRSCAGTSCSIVDAVAIGEGVAVIGTVSGDAVANDDTWYIILYEGDEAFVHSSLLSQSLPAVNVSDPVTTNSSNSNNSRPANCEEARAMGLSAQQAAQWSHLDRDKDGVACYGD